MTARTSRAPDIGAAVEMNALTSTTKGFISLITADSTFLGEALASVENPHLWGPLKLPALTSLTWSADFPAVPHVSGAGAEMDPGDLDVLTWSSATTCNQDIRAQSGALLDLGSLATIVIANPAKKLTFRSEGAGSIIDLSSLSDYDPAQVVFSATDGGVILLPGGVVVPAVGAR